VSVRGVNIIINLANSKFRVFRLNIYVLEAYKVHWNSKEILSVVEKVMEIGSYNLLRKQLQVLRAFNNFSL
jgi:hypothetical protein